MNEWLQANGIDPKLTPMWPDLEIDSSAGKIRIEQFVRIPDTVQDELGSLAQPVIMYDEPGSRMVEYDLVVPMGDELDGMWHHMAERAREERILSTLLVKLHEARVTVVHAQAGNRLVLLTRSVGSGQDGAELEHRLEQMLPGVAFMVVTDVAALIGAGPDLNVTYHPKVDELK